MPVYDKKYIKAKVNEFNGVFNANFLSNEMPEEAVYYTCITWARINSVMKIEKKNYPQVYLEDASIRWTRKRCLRL